MPIATLTSKGQVTIPKRTREHLALHAGDRIDFVELEDGSVLLRPLSSSIEDVFGVLKQEGQSALSVEEMNEGVRKYLSQK